MARLSSVDPSPFVCMLSLESGMVTHSPTLCYAAIQILLHLLRRDAGGITQNPIEWNMVK